jgi:site-specific DNA-methyltransferase (adenine-specific)
VSASIQDVLEGRANWALIQGDCLEVLPTLADKSVAHVITDPPYEAEAHTKGRRIKIEGGGGDYGAVDLAPLTFEPMTEADRLAVGAQISRLVTRWAVAFCQVEATQKWAAAFSAIQYVRTGVWVKPDAQPQLSGDRPGMGYESIVFAHPRGRKRWNGGGRCGVFVHNKEQFGGKAPHPTTKPLPLMLELVELFTDPGDIVLDPFAGSGTAGVACLRLGRRFIGIEKDEKYAAIARERLQAETQGLSLRDVRHGQQGLFGNT